MMWFRKALLFNSVVSDVYYHLLHMIYFYFIINFAA